MGMYIQVGLNTKLNNKVVICPQMNDQVGKDLFLSLSYFTFSIRTWQIWLKFLVELLGRKLVVENFQVSDKLF